MFLNFFQAAKEWLISLFEKFSWFDIIPLITGLIVGILLSGLFYLIVIMTSVRREQKKIKANDTIVDDEYIKKAILSAQNTYNEDSLDLNTGEKVVAIKNVSWDLINDIAKAHYPEAKYPIFELSIEELLLLNHYITQRIEHIFSGRLLRKAKKIKVSTIVKVLDMKKKIDENKLVKAATTTTRSKPVRFLLTAANFLNPGYWAKKIFTTAILPGTVNKLANLIIEIVGEETKRVYSKNAFIEDEEREKIEKTIKDFESEIEQDIK